jgi:hypothetical protein
LGLAVPGLRLRLAVSRLGLGLAVSRLRLPVSRLRLPVSRLGLPISLLGLAISLLGLAISLLRLAVFRWLAVPLGLAVLLRLPERAATAGEGGRTPVRARAEPEDVIEDEREQDKSHGERAAMTEALGHVNGDDDPDDKECNAPNEWDERQHDERHPPCWAADYFQEHVKAVDRNESRPEWLARLLKYASKRDRDDDVQD